MKNTVLFFITIISFMACKQNNSKQSSIKTKQVDSLGITQKIANAHGFKNWDHVEQLNFTFNVDKDDSHFERTWLWNPKTDNVTFISEKDTITYNRALLDSTTTKTDKAFINDKFWLLIPFQMVWDKGISVTHPIHKIAPISNQELNMITLNYPKEGGYTPGDAYDIFYNDEFIIQEWIYRKGNSDVPSLISTFENHQDFKGLKIALEHKKAEENWNLNFSNISVSLVN